jgi:toxin YoeB
MKIIWSERAWEDYLYWQATDPKLLKRVNELIKAIQRQPFQGIGDPEPLKHDFAGFWSRRVNREHRLVYRVDANGLAVAACRYHYAK